MPHASTSRLYCKLSVGSLASQRTDIVSGADARWRGSYSFSPCTSSDELSIQATPPTPNPIAIRSLRSVPAFGPCIRSLHSVPAFGPGIRSLPFGPCIPPGKRRSINVCCFQSQVLDSSQPASYGLYSYGPICLLPTGAG